MPNGDIVDLMSELHKDNSGYNLKHLLIGAEGTLGIITRAVLKLSPKPKAYATAMLAVPVLADALELLNTLQADTGGAVEAFEYMPRSYFEGLAHIKPNTRPPFEQNYETNILLEVASTIPADAQVQSDGSIPLVSKLEAMLGDLFERGKLLDAVIAKSEAERREMWERREAAAEVQLANPPLVNNDVAVPLDQVDTFLDQAQKRVREIHPDAPMMGIAHLGDGNLHLVVELGNRADLKDPVMEAVEDVVMEFGGSFSAEHGIGLTKLPSMARRKNPAALAAMRAIKQALDPKNLMNPGKVIP